MELKPCPFCGGEAERLELTDEENFGGSVITCKKCGASSPVHFDRKENLYSSWNERMGASGNRRASEADIVALEADRDLWKDRYESLLADAQRMEAGIGERGE